MIGLFSENIKYYIYCLMHLILSFYLNSNVKNENQYILITLYATIIKDKLYKWIN